VAHRGDGGSIKVLGAGRWRDHPNSQHPRTELDSLTNFKAGTSPHTLNATLVVSQAPSTNQDIITPDPRRRRHQLRAVRDAAL